MLTTLAWTSLVLASIPAALSVCNLLLFRRAPMPIVPDRSRALAAERLSVLVPARNEAHNIEACLEGILAMAGVELEVLVLDDHSDDDTVAKVRRIAARDRRVRLLRSRPLPSGWNGKQHACWQLARAARHEWLLFLDADVRIAPDAARRLLAAAERSGTRYLSGFPRQLTGTWLEHLLIPLIHFVLLGYLPLVGMRLTRWAAFGAGCGQLVLVEREAYFSADGHRAVRESRHDGLQLPRSLRKSGLETDLVDATDLATCRMYHDGREVWNGLAKNATEGMASRGGILVWTLLLFGGHVLPWLILGAAWVADTGAVSPIVSLAAGAALASVATRALLALRFRQSPLGVLLHPLSILLLLAIQIFARWREELGLPVSWKGRAEA